MNRSILVVDDEGHFALEQIAHEAEVDLDRHVERGDGELPGLLCARGRRRLRHGLHASAREDDREQSGGHACTEASLHEATNTPRDHAVPPCTKKGHARVQA